jgi:hypothetical protein
VAGVGLNPNEIRQRAKEVNDYCLHYHMSHAILACFKVLGNVLEDSKDKKIKELQEQLGKSQTKGSTKKIAAELALVERPCHIAVQYVDDMDPGAGRIIRLPDSYDFIISLPYCVLQNSLTNDGLWYNAAGVKQLRELMAHEIGHFVLYTEEMLTIDSTNGSNCLSKEAHDNATIFGRELIRLRHERNDKLNNDTALKAAF